MNTSLPKTLLAALALSIATTAAMAGDEPTTAEADAPTPASFASLDKNSDGGLTPTEIPADDPLTDSFPDADSDGNGQLSKEEYDAFQGL